MSSDQSVFTFELNETLYFQSGQEVEELRSISLDPDISIQALNDYITITGVIELSGEYNKVTSIENEDQINNFQNEAKRFIEQVEDRNEEEAAFTHRFPVEISIPTYRVENLDEISVSVESFDYELPDNDQLKLYSTIAIYGIKQENREKENIEEIRNEYDESTEVQSLDSNEEVVDVNVEREVEESFEFELKQKQEDELPEEVELSNTLDTPILASERESHVEEEPQKEKKKEDSGEGRWLFKTESQSFSEFFGKDDKKDTDDDSIDDFIEDDQEENEPPIDSEEKTESIREAKDITYLSDIFRKTEEEEYTRMRLCIVQKDDTIETISERFEVSPLQVIKHNNLEDDFDVSEGQILYIPTKK